MSDIEKEGNLNKYVDIHYIDPMITSFEWTEGGFLSMQYGETKYPRVHLHRAFPLSHIEVFISVRDPEGKEIGIIESFAGFDSAVTELMQKEIDRRYFVPDITKIVSIKEEFGYSYWSVSTNAGPRRFTVRSGHSNVAQVDKKRVLVIDADGNRFMIPDLMQLTPHEMKLIEPLLTT